MKPLRLFALVGSAVCLMLWTFVQPATARTLQQIRALNTISMCAHPDSLPYATNQGDPPGFQVEIGRAIAQELGVGLRVEWLVPRRRIAEVNCDMLMDRPSDPARQEGRLLSVPYQRTGIALAVRSDSEASGNAADPRQHARVGVMVGSLASVVLGRQGVRTRPYAFQADMIEDLRKGELSAAAVSEPSLSFFLRQQPRPGTAIAARRRRAATLRCHPARTPKSAPRRQANRGRGCATAATKAARTARGRQSNRPRRRELQRTSTSNPRGKSPRVEMK